MKSTATKKPGTARPGGRPRKTEDPRGELFKARQAARLVLETWDKHGGPEQVEQGKFSLLCRLSFDDQARINRWFPVIVDKKSRHHVWDLSILRSIIRWDDPVDMLRYLAVTDPGTWWGVLGAAEKVACSKLQEEVVRRAFDALRMSVTVPGDPLVTRDFPLFKENNEKRL